MCSECFKLVGLFRYLAENYLVVTEIFHVLLDYDMEKFTYQVKF